MDSELTREANHFNFEAVRPATLVPQPGPRKERRPQIQVHFVCRIEHKYYHTSSLDKSNVLTLINSREETSQQVFEFDQCLVFYSPDEFRADLSRVLSKFKIREDDDVVQMMADEIKRLASKIYDESWGKRIFALEASVSRKHDMIRCKSFLAGRDATQDSIMSAD